MTIIKQICQRALKPNYNEDFYSSVAGLDLSAEAREIYEFENTGFLDCKTSKEGYILASTTSGTLCVFESDCKFSFQKRVSCLGIRTVDWVNNINELFVCGTSQGDVVLGSVETESVISTYEVVPNESQIRCVSAKDDLIAWSSLDGLFGVLDRRCNKNCFIIKRAHQIKNVRSCTVSSIVFTPNQSFQENLLITGGSTDGTIKIWDFRNCSNSNLAEIPRLRKDILRGQGIVSLSLDFQGKCLLSGRRGGDIVLHGLSSSVISSENFRFDQRSYFISSGNEILNAPNATVRLCATNNIVGLSGYGGCVAFSLNNPADALRLDVDGNECMSGCDFLPDGSFVSVSEQGYIRKWESQRRGLKKRKVFQELTILETTQELLRKGSAYSMDLFH